MSTGRRGTLTNIVLLSIDSVFADRIYSGEKRYEFRKTPLPPDIEYVVLLENGSRKVTGGFLVGDTYVKDVDALWEEYGREISDKDRFYQYYSGWDEGLALEVSESEEYKEEFDIDELMADDPSLEVPSQFHFVYMSTRTLRRISQNSQFLDNLLPESKETTLDRYGSGSRHTSDLNYRPMRPPEEEQFRDLFSESPVPSDYADISQEFIDHIIESHKLGEDPYGYFTKKKEVYSLIADGDLIGFTTTTRKRGGSVKYGPTVIKEDERGKGYGPKLRKLIDSGLAHSGIRKAYSTIPEIAERAYSYLIKSGYKVEAHLHHQYTERHSELVFGKVLNSAPVPDCPIRERDEVKELDFDIGSENYNEFGDFVKQQAEPWYRGINDDFVTAVQDAEDRGLKSEFSKKGKRVYIGHRSGSIECIAISSIKRGSAVKISPIFTDAIGKGFIDYLEFIEDDLIGQGGIRKLYTHVPVLDGQLIHSLMAKNYQSEGVIREPYKGGIDMLVLAKMVP